MLLEMKNITKWYGDNLAVDNVSITLEKGEILALAGENGAGKSTIMKVLYGLEEKNAGEIYINGKLKNIKNPTDAIKNGIGMVQQHFMLFPEYTVAENVVYGKEPRNRSIFFDNKKAYEDVIKLSKEHNLDIDPRAKIKNCPVGIQQRTEILKVLYQGADIIVFDEPTAVLTPQEIRSLLDTMKNLVTLGKSIILITHKLQEIMDVADRVLVMREGKIVGNVLKEDTSIKELSNMMVGRDIEPMEVKKIERGKTVLEVSNLYFTNKEGNNVLNGINLNVGEYEIVGIAGISGNGQSKLIDIITGMEKAEKGSIKLLDKEILNSSVKEIRDVGCACIPEDRYLTGVAALANLNENILMGHQKKEEFCKNGLLNINNINDFSANIIEDYDVRSSSSEQLVGELSGGNAQKLVVGREISQNTKFMIAAEPTRGVDIGAKESIHKKLLKKREEGGAILLISSELSEITYLSDRIYTIYNGRINGEFTREEATFEKLGLKMMGGELEND